MQPVKFQPLSGSDVYLMAFRLAAPRPVPDKIQACGAKAA
jgi:hypothetical protein